MDTRLRLGARPSGSTRGDGWTRARQLDPRQRLHPLRDRPGTPLPPHLSPRDLGPEAILSSVHIADDGDHVCHRSTSPHQPAEERSGQRDLVADSIGAILTGGRHEGRPAAPLTVFSPFALGVLDLAVADLVRHRAREEGPGPDALDCPPPRAG
ncbi:hypothetical protein GCM10018980_17580 [Streptomyces capoamus]|uniref:Uncharacterized protein n=1 Tax=Streptomyces capoamus TaxID=68183 RepID=A0A919EVY1_9ACTN|nr:hypothetical protein [Streptomyces capoamus]GGW16150.1 hypothetical protein GCM10010501_31200 [Streptomyces libani subsp. rufus]GHG42148.1 hypothetical protein GCM10018980_17580 [Streptomyces capoamus]